MPPAPHFPCINLIYLNSVSSHSEFLNLYLDLPRGQPWHALTLGEQLSAFEFLAADVKSRSDATWQEGKASENVERVQGVVGRQEVKACGLVL